MRTFVNGCLVRESTTEMFLVIPNGNMYLPMQYRIQGIRDGNYSIMLKLSEKELILFKADCL
jgi:hypothetical protein